MPSPRDAEPRRRSRGRDVAEGVGEVAADTAGDLAFGWIGRGLWWIVKLPFRAIGALFDG